MSFTVEPLRFGGNDVVALIVIPLAFVGLALFLRTRLGLAMRACADDVDRAALVGIPVRRVHSVVWAIAALLAFLAVFLRAGIVGLSLGTVLGPSLLLPALAAAVIGRMERLPDHRGRRDRARHRRAVGACGGGTNRATCTRCSSSSWSWRSG